MLRIKRDTDYAIRCVLNLSKQEKRFSRIDALSAEEEIPRPFVAKIMHRLNKQGIVQSQRGKGGGYSLAVTPSQLTVFDVVKAMEALPLINICLNGENVCKRKATCPIHTVCKDVEQNLIKNLQIYSFQYLVDKS